jgi:hypothetical protein
VTLAIEDCALFVQPLTTSPSPFIIASKPFFALVSGVVLWVLSDVGVGQTGTLEEFGVGRTGHQDRDHDTAVGSFHSA